MIFKNDNKNNNYYTISDIINQYKGAELTNKHNSKFWFKIHLSPEAKEIEIESLNLSMRSLNCLKRAKINTINDIIKWIVDGNNLKNIKNCGEKSSREIMENIFVLQYNLMSSEEQKKFIEEVIQLNQEKRTVNSSNY